MHAPPERPAAAERHGTLTQRLDALNEFDREPVTDGHLQGRTNFIGFYAGEHVAGTEFVIGPWRRLVLATATFASLTSECAMSLMLLGGCVLPDRSGVRTGPSAPEPPQQQ